MSVEEISKIKEWIIENDGQIKRIKEKEKKAFNTMDYSLLHDALSEKSFLSGISFAYNNILELMEE